MVDQVSEYPQTGCSDCVHWKDYWGEQVLQRFLPVGELLQCTCAYQVNNRILSGRGTFDGKVHATPSLSLPYPQKTFSCLILPHALLSNWDGMHPHSLPHLWNEGRSSSHEEEKGLVHAVARHWGVHRWLEELKGYFQPCTPPGSSPVSYRDATFLLRRALNSFKVMKRWLGDLESATFWVGVFFSHGRHWL